MNVDMLKSALMVAAVIAAIFYLNNLSGRKLDTAIAA